MSPYYFFKILFILFSLALRLHCRPWVVASGGRLSGGSGRASRCSGFCCSSQVLGYTGSVAVMRGFVALRWRVGSSRTRDQTHVPCIGRHADSYPLDPKASPSAKMLRQVCMDKSISKEARCLYTQWNITQLLIKMHLNQF